MPPDDRKYLSDFALWLIGTDNHCVFFYEFIALIISAVIGLFAYCFSNKNLKEDYVKNIISAYYGLDIYIEMVSVEKKLFRITFFSNAWIIFLFVIWLVFQHYINYDKFIVDIVFAVILFFSYLVLTLIYDTKKHLNNIYVQKKK
ncbi:hypothetical protein EST62_10035 [Chlorobaculum sp. 24CR]|uniref:hypothetical protein n=1 Tax=Chlorobaculum sp. 24CR TaxID=2508878 RepID=UPI00100B8EE0|nr:hypothetical protein [Chlorobaculum sp. 24CR]RXK84115.1 hypothetical protein EST62_10035 [Chlorobaculum sp. 24CR]